VRPDYWQYLTEVLLGFAVTLTAIFTRPTLAQCDWQLLAMGVAVMMLATISDELASRGASAARRGVLFSPQRDGPREWIWSALGVPPGRVLVVDLVERRLTIAGQPAWVYLFVATLSFSRRLYVKVYRYEDQTTWLDGLENAFFYFGGVPREVRFVNSRSFFQCDPRTEENHANKRLRTFASYWRFSPRPCPFGRGSDSPSNRLPRGKRGRGACFR
jgi:Integrase core domain